MALATLSIDIVAKLANLEQTMGNASRIAEKNAKRMEAAFSKAGMALGAIGGAIGVGSMVAWVKGAADAAVQVDRLSKVANAGTAEFQKWAYGARTVGIEQDKLGDILKDVNDKVGEFVATGGGPLKDFFEQVAPRVGVTAEQFRRLSGPDALGLYVSSLEKAGLSQQQMTFYMEALASDSTALLPLLRNNGEAMRALGDEAERAGAVMSGRFVAASQDLNKNLDRLQTLSTKVAAEVGNVLIPEINRLAAEFLDARSAGMGFVEALTGIGLSNPAKGAGEQVAEIRDTLDRMRNGAWYEKPWNSIGGAEEEQRLERLLDYYKRRQKAEADATISADNLSGMDRRLQAEAERRAEAEADALKRAAEAREAARKAAEKAAKETAAATAKAAADYDRLIESIRTKIAVQEAEGAATEKLTEGQKLAAQLVAQLRDGTLQLTDARQQGLSIALSELITTEKANLARADAAELERQYAENLAAALGPIEQRAQALEHELETYGLTEAQIQTTIAARIEEALQIAKANGAADEHISYLEREIAARKRIAAAAGSIEARKATDDAARNAQDEWRRTADSIEQSLTDALMRGFENGEDFGENLRDTLVNMFKTLVLRPTLQPIAQFGGNLVGSVLNSATGGLLGGGGGGGRDWLGTASNTYSAYNALSASGSALYGYASGTMSGANAAGSVYANYTGTGLDGLLATNGAYGTGAGAASGAGVSTIGSLGAGLAGGLWAYNQTGSYTAGVAGAAGSTALYGAAVGYASGAGAAAGASSALGTLGPWGWVAAAVVAVLADVFADDPDPRLTYQMSKDLSRAFEDQHKGIDRVSAEGPFGRIGLHPSSKEVDAQDLTSHFQALASLDAAIASGLDTTEIEAVRARMDGWTSSYGHRRNSGNAVKERLWAIVDGIGGDIAADVTSYADRVESDNIKPLRAKWEQQQRASLAILQKQQEHGGGMLSALGRQAERAEYEQALAEYESFRSLGDDEWLAAARRADAVRRFAGELPGDTVHGWLMGHGRVGLNADQSATTEQIVARLMKVIFVDDLQEGLGRMGQTIGKDAALAWMDTAKFTATGTDASGKETKTELTGFAAVANQLEQVHALLYAKPLDAITAQWRAFQGLFEELGEQTVPSNVVAYRAMVEAIDLNSEAGRNLYLNLAALAPQVVAIQETLLAAIGTTRDTLASAVSAGLAGNAAADEVAGLLNNAVLGGIRAAITAEVAHEITDLMIGGIINPAIEAMLLGGELTEAIGSVQIETAVAQIESRAAALEAVISAPAVQASLAAMQDAMARIGATVGRVGSALNTSAAAAKAAEEAAKAAEEAQRRHEAAVKSAEDALRDAYQRHADELQQTVDRFGEFVRSLREFREGLLLGEQSPLSLTERSDEAARQFAAISARARVGDTDAIEQLQDISAGYLDASRESAASAEEYYRAFGKVQAVLLDTESVAERHVRIAQQQYDQITTQVSALITINDSVLSVREAIEALVAARGAAAGTTSGTSIPAGSTTSGTAANAGSRDWPDWLDALPTGLMYNWAVMSPELRELSAGQRALYFERERALRSLPKFADGGLHSGGLRLVGEQGPELEATGPARIWSAEQTKQLLRGSGGGNEALLAEVRALRTEVASLRAAGEATARHTHETSRTLTRVTRGGDAMQVEEAA